MYRVLIADDEQYIRDRVANHMPWLDIGFEVIGSADSGEQALHMFEQSKPDALLTDILMPGMTGLELIQRIKEKHPQTKIIVMSAYDDFKYAQQAMRLGVKGYLLKPIIREEFIELLQTVANELHTEMTEHGPSKQALIDEGRKPKQSNTYVIAAMQYVDEHYSDRIRLEDVAEFLFVNPNYFSSLFKREMGVSFVDYVNETRIQKSISLLLETDEKVYEVSMQVGFGNFSYFNKMFKRFKGLTPQEYREQNRNPKKAEGTKPS